MELNELKQRCPELVAEIKREAIDEYVRQQRGDVAKFPFYRSYWESANALPKASRSKFITGLVDYAFTGLIPQFDSYVAAAFINAQPNIDSSIRSSAAGTTGGRPRKNQKVDDAVRAQIEEIVAYLNEKAGKRYRASNQETIRNINARLSEGCTVDDFRYVIDVKCAEWLGDAKMEKYLCPQTLFTPSHFEKYLNQAKPKEEPAYDEYD